MPLDEVWRSDVVQATGNLSTYVKVCHLDGMRDELCFFGQELLKTCKISGDGRVSPKSSPCCYFISGFKLDLSDALMTNVLVAFRRVQENVAHLNMANATWKGQAKVTPSTIPRPTNPYIPDEYRKDLLVELLQDYHASLKKSFANTTYFARRIGSPLNYCKIPRQDMVDFFVQDPFISASHSYQVVMHLLNSCHDPPNDVLLLEDSYVQVLAMTAKELWRSGDDIDCSFPGLSELQCLVGLDALARCEDINLNHLGGGCRFCACKAFFFSQNVTKASDLPHGRFIYWMFKEAQKKLDKKVLLQRKKELDLSSNPKGPETNAIMKRSVLLEADGNGTRPNRRMSFTRGVVPERRNPDFWRHNPFFRPVVPTFVKNETWKADFGSLAKILDEGQLPDIALFIPLLKSTKFRFNKNLSTNFEDGPSKMRYSGHKLSLVISALKYLEKVIGSKINYPKLWCAKLNKISDHISDSGNMNPAEKVILQFELLLFCSSRNGESIYEIVTSGKTNDLAAEASELIHQLKLNYISSRRGGEIERRCGVQIEHSESCYLALSVLSQCISTTRDQENCPLCLCRAFHFGLKEDSEGFKFLQREILAVKEVFREIVLSRMSL